MQWIRLHACNYICPLCDQLRHAAGSVHGLPSVQAWFTKAQLEPIFEWANTHTASHAVYGIPYVSGLNGTTVT